MKNLINKLEKELQKIIIITLSKWVGINVLEISNWLNKSKSWFFDSSENNNNKVDNLIDSFLNGDSTNLQNNYNNYKEDFINFKGLYFKTWVNG